MEILCYLSVSFSDRLTVSHTSDRCLEALSLRRDANEASGARVNQTGCDSLDAAMADRYEHRRPACEWPSVATYRFGTAVMR